MQQSILEPNYSRAAKGELTAYRVSTYLIITYAFTQPRPLRVNFTELINQFSMVIPKFSFARIVFYTVPACHRELSESLAVAHFRLEIQPVVSQLAQRCGWMVQFTAVRARKELE